MAFALKLPIEVARLIASMHVPQRTCGYPVVYVRRDTEPGEDDEIVFAALPDSEKAAIQEWYREHAATAASSHNKWRALMDEREEARIQSEAETLWARINALDTSSGVSLLFDNHAFSSPQIRGFGNSLACGICGSRLPKSEQQYLSKPQRIYCPYCELTLAERTEIRSQPHPSKGYAPLLRVPGKRDFVFVHTRLPGQ